MQQDLELKALLFPLIPHIHRRLQAVPAKRDAVLQSKVIWPGLAYLGAERGRVQAEIKLDAVMIVVVTPVIAAATATGIAALFEQGIRLGRRLAEILPSGVAGEAMRRESRCCMLGRRGTEVL